MLMASPSRAPLPRFVRADGGVRVAIARVGGRSMPMRIAESGGYRVRFPGLPAACEGVLINTGGGMTGGDRMRVEVALGERAEATLTTQAAEKIYRSQGDDASVSVAIDLAGQSSLDWLPQEQILFDQARFRRAVAVDMAADARLLFVEALFFGRAAMGESFETGAFRDSWRVRRGGRLVFAEDVRLDGDVGALLARPALGGDARAVATALLVSPDAEARRDEARDLLAGASSECGLSAWNGLLLARFLNADAAALRADLARFLQAFRGRALPRSWQT